MNELALLASISVTAAFVAGVIAVVEHRRRDQSDVVEFRLRLAAALDALHEAQHANDTLQALLNEHERTIVTLVTERNLSTDTIVSMIKSLNSINARCAALQSTQHGIQNVQPYWLVQLSDGTTAGPFSRS